MTSLVCVFRSVIGRTLVARIVLNIAPNSGLRGIDERGFLSAHGIRYLPKDDRSLRDPFVVDAGLPRATNSRGGGWTIEDSDRVLGVVSGQRHELAENPG